MSDVKVPAVAVDAYVRCALWSSTDDEGVPLDGGGYELSDEARGQLADDLQDFADLVYRECDGWWLRLDWAQLAHDFWLTRNGHGAGFWDRGLGELGDRLTELAKAAGGCDLYVGDDGLIYAA